MKLNPFRRPWNWIVTGYKNRQERLNNMSQPPAQPPMEFTRGITFHAVRLYEQPYAEESITGIPVDSRIIVLDTRHKHFVKIKFNDQRGWIPRTYFRDEPEPETQGE